MLIPGPTAAFDRDTALELSEELQPFHAQDREMRGLVKAHKASRGGESVGAQDQTCRVDEVCRPSGRGWLAPTTLIQ